MRDTLQGIESQLPTLEKILRIIQGDASDVEAHELLKLTIPIIPFVLAYEHELELGQRTSIQRLWSRLTGK